MCLLNSNTVKLLVDRHMLPMRTLTDEEIREMRDKYYQAILDVLQQADDWMRENADLIYLLDRYTAKEIKELLIVMTALALKEIDDIINRVITERKIKGFDCKLERFWVEGKLYVWVSCTLVLEWKEEDRLREYKMMYVYGDDTFEVEFIQRPNIDENVTVITVSAEPIISEKLREPDMPVIYVNKDVLNEWGQTPGVAEKIDEVLKDAEKKKCRDVDTDKLKMETIIAYYDMLTTKKEYTNEEVEIMCNVAKNCQDVECEALVPNDEDDILTISYLFLVLDIDENKYYTVLHQETPILGAWVRKIFIAVTTSGVFLKE